MKNIESVPLPKSYLLLNHGPTTLITSAHGDRRNVMAAAWVMPLDFDPPKVLAVIDKNTLTRELIEAAGEFAINIPNRAIAAQTLAAGSRSGRDGDKFAACGLATFPARRVAAPLVAGCVGWLECRVVAEPRNQQTYDLFIAEVLHAAADTDAFSAGCWHFDAAAQATIHYQAGGRFFSTGEGFDA
ncbi:MAG: flavin reductase family protein [Rhodocyclales bacterium]|nr:flavin reductase family protein [Rhodocyclales bacterium]